MSLEDPFFVVREEVQKALHTAHGLYTRWNELQDQPNLVSKEETDWTSNELRNCLRSIEWDLEDLEETVDILYSFLNLLLRIVEKNPRKFKITENEIRERRNFIERTKASVKEMKGALSSPKSSNYRNGIGEDNVRQSLLSNGPSRPQDRYTRLDEEMETSNQRYIDDAQQQQALIMRSQDDTLELIGGSVGVLKNMSHQISGELDEQNVMLDEFRHEIESTDSRLDGTMKKMAKVLHMSNDKRQWTAIIVLIVILVIILILFFVL
ncbi:hypothetical protein LOTGIDRAFT_129177 [Lottia gigantea]|uniref:t-SNARE coiled-coil homology domain-containing protein n=1 Tax=Lottia gigantea TaxID=225164 RepID=V3ZUY4_LOTGI|nr:hypothetical protein LOTGIDRAFT_129177 [Lottia gigantea]ESO86355.1 hypothetical protein LOTGIDRAFT_129177 [Lottia gigantea]